MSLDLIQAKTQLVAVAKECLASLPSPVQAGGVARYWHTEERFPYFTCRTSFDTVTWDSEDFDRDTYTLVLKLVVGHLSGGYKGEREEELDTWIPALKTYINARELLQCNAYPDPVTGLIRARVDGISGFGAFQNSGLAETQVGTDFNVLCEFDETIEQAYN
jgi:hypothetical protein